MRSAGATRTHGCRMRRRPRRTAPPTPGRAPRGRPCRRTATRRPDPSGPPPKRRRRSPRRRPISPARSRRAPPCCSSGRRRTSSASRSARCSRRSCRPGRAGLDPVRRRRTCSSSRSSASRASWRPSRTSPVGRGSGGRSISGRGGRRRKPKPSRAPGRSRTIVRPGGADQPLKTATEPPAPGPQSRSRPETGRPREPGCGADAPAGGGDARAGRRLLPANEPASPIPLLVDRACGLSQKDFLTLLKDILPGLKVTVSE